MLMDTDGRGVVQLTKTRAGIENRDPSWLHVAYAVTPIGSLTTTWAEVKR